jgi:K+-sensing histidine kinase KdpD
VVYLPGVLVVSTVWGLILGAATAVPSIAAFDFFHVQPALQFVRAVSQAFRRAARAFARGARSRGDGERH